MASRLCAGTTSRCYIEIRFVRLLDIDCFIVHSIERKKAECMHVRAGTNKDGVSLGRNTTPPPSSWTAHAEKHTKM